jgi:hypothetical protein
MDIWGSVASSVYGFFTRGVQDVVHWSLDTTFLTCRVYIPTSSTKLATLPAAL